MNWHYRNWGWNSTGCGEFDQSHAFDHRHRQQVYGNQCLLQRAFMHRDLHGKAGWLVYLRVSKWIESDLERRMSVSRQQHTVSKYGVPHKQRNV